MKAQLTNIVELFIIFTDCLTNIAEENRQEDEAMSCAKHHHAQVHAEVENLEEL